MTRAKRSGNDARNKWKEGEKEIANDKKLFEETTEKEKVYSFKEVESFTCVCMGKKNQ